MRVQFIVHYLTHVLTVVDRMPANREKQDFVTYALLMALLAIMLALVAIALEYVFKL